MKKFYPSKISERFHYPKHAGKCEFANAVGTNASFVCGSVLRISLQISEQKVVNAKFQVSGCGYLIATADLLAETILNQQLNELHGLENLTQIVEEYFGKFPVERTHCLELAIDTLHSAFNDFRSHKLEEFAGEKALICTCFGVSEDLIERVILQNQCETVEDVMQICNAGGGCGSCQPLIQEIIDCKTQAF